MSSVTSDIDQLCEFAINYLLMRQGDGRSLAVALARGAPDRAASEVILILASAAASIEEVLTGPETHHIALETWRAAAMLGVELHMMQLRDRPRGTCGDLLDYWQTEDMWFLGP
jgi:hypothetical protein